MSSKPLPGALVFDLDGCLWAPEMYELWGRGGAPFTLTKNGNLKDRGGEEVQLLGDVRNIMLELKTDDKWKNTVIGVASTCDEPSWAKECIDKFPIGKGHHLKDVLHSHLHIYKANKSRQLTKISEDTGIPLNETIFFDNQSNNCMDVSQVNVTVAYVPDGITRSAFEDALKQYPAPGQILGPKLRSGWW